jgi:hypothetical protein
MCRESYVWLVGLKINKKTNLFTEKGGAYWLSRNVGNQLPTYSEDIPRQWRLRHLNFETGAELARSVMHEIKERMVSHFGHESHRYVYVCHVAARQRPGSESLMWQ